MTLNIVEQWKKKHSLFTISKIQIQFDSRSTWRKSSLHVKQFQWLDRIFMHSGRFYFFSLFLHQKLQKSHLDLSLCLFFAEEECFSDWSRQDLTAAINKRRTTNTTTNKYNTRYEAWGPIVDDDDDDDLVFWIVMNKTSTNVTYCTSTSTIIAWNASSIHTLIRLIFKSRSLSFSLSSDSWALMKWWWSWSIVIGHGNSNKKNVSTSLDFDGYPEEVNGMGIMKS